MYMYMYLLLYKHDVYVNVNYVYNIHPHILIFDLLFLQRTDHKARRTLDNCAAAGDNAAHARQLRQVSVNV